MVQLSKQEIEKRKLCFTPCQTKKDLWLWIKIFLDLDIPDGRVDPASNSSPMELIWEVYETTLKNDENGTSRLLAFASRDSFKTLSSAILEILMIVHMKRSVAHMAAQESQAVKAQSYVKKFFSNPILRDFVLGDNKRRVEIVHYESKFTKEIINQKEWEKTEYQNDYKKNENYITIIIGTIAGAKSEHVPYMSLDECDVINPKAYEEAKMIPGPMNGQNPFTLLASTRQFSFGLVQKEIDEAAQTGLEIRHWNLLDVCSSCPPKRHRPDLPKIPIYVDLSNLQAISKDKFDNLNETSKEKYIEKEGYQGCLSNCSLFSQCMGRLVTEQTSNSPLLKPISHVQNMFKKVSLETAKSQLLCWKPSTEGLVFPRFEQDTHLISIETMYQMLTGEAATHFISLDELYRLLNRLGATYYVGMDFGYSHCFAYVLGAVVGNNIYVIDAQEISGLELAQRISLCEQKLKSLDPIIYPDTAYPADIKTFKRHGFKMRDWNKGKDSVLAGIEALRMKIYPGVGNPEFFILNSESGKLLAKRLSEYHWVLDSAGRPTEVPDKDNDDLVDACRYMVQNVFPLKGKTQLLTETQTPAEANMLALGEFANAQKSPDPTQENWLQQLIAPHLDPNAMTFAQQISQATTEQRSSGIYFDY